MPTFLDLLYDEAPLAAFDEHLAQAERGLGEADAAGPAGVRRRRCGCAT